MELAKAFVQIVPSANGIKGSISDVLDPEANSAGGKAGKSIASKIKGAISVAAIGAAIGKSLTEGAALEQSIGGIETLFKDSSDAVIKNANEAFKTAGLSANEYMETATSFSASLLQGLGGDTQAAAKVTDMAIKDMSDNANKMGTDMASIQMAYQGFAKQNYVMLDNLKLGYGGTKTEMQRLLADAEKITGVKYDLNNLSDVYNAIHVIQGELDITGTTAKEAATTFAGSMASMKASFNNLMGALMTGGDVTTALSQLTDTALTFVMGNLAPALGRIVSAIPTLAVQLVTNVIPNIIDKIQVKLDSLLKNASVSSADKWGKSFGSKITDGLIKLLPKILKLIGTLVVKLPPLAIQAASSFVSGMVDRVLNGIKSLVSRIKEAFKFNITLPKIKLPHFAISPAGWKLGDLLKGSVPTLGINWYAKGGIFDGASLIGVGEAGPEAVLPLDTFWSKMDKIADNSTGATVVNFNGNYSFRDKNDIDYFMKQSERLINRRAVLG